MRLFYPDPEEEQDEDRDPLEPISMIWIKKYSF